MSLSQVDGLEQLRIQVMVELQEVDDRQPLHQVDLVAIRRSRQIKEKLQAVHLSMMIQELDHLTRTSMCNEPLALKSQVLLRQFLQ